MLGAAYISAVPLHVHVVFQHDYVENVSLVEVLDNKTVPQSTMLDQCLYLKQKGSTYCHDVVLSGHTVNACNKHHIRRSFCDHSTDIETWLNHFHFLKCIIDKTQQQNRSDISRHLVQMIQHCSTGTMDMYVSRRLRHQHCVAFGSYTIIWPLPPGKLVSFPWAMRTKADRLNLLCNKLKASEVETRLIPTNRQHLS